MHRSHRTTTFITIRSKYSYIVCRTIHTGANIFVQCAYINTSHLMYLTCSLHVRVICTMSCCTLLVQVTYTSHYTLLFEHLCTLYILQWKYMQCAILWNYMYYAKYTRCIPLPTLYQAVQCYNVNTTCKHLLYHMCTCYFALMSTIRVRSLLYIKHIWTVQSTMYDIYCST